MPTISRDLGALRRPARSGLFSAMIAPARSTASSSTSASCTLSPERVFISLRSSPRIEPKATCWKFAGLAPAGGGVEELAEMQLLRHADDIPDLVAPSIRRCGSRWSPGRWWRRGSRRRALRMIAGLSVQPSSLWIMNGSSSGVSACRREKTQTAPSLSRAMPLARNSSTSGGEAVVVEALAEPVVEATHRAGRRFSAGPAWKARRTSARWRGSRHRPPGVSPAPALQVSSTAAIVLGARR